MSEHVTVGTDGSRPATIAVKWAAEDATRRGAALRIVHVFEPWGHDLPYQPVPEAPEGIARYSEGILDAAAEVARAQAPATEVTTALLSGRIIGMLIKESDDALQIVVGSRGVGGFAGMLMGSVSIGLAGHAACPVVVVRGGQDTVQGQIVVGFDGAAHSEGALEYAFAEAERRTARVQVVYAWQAAILSPYASGYSAYFDDLFAAGKHTVEERLRAWNDRYPRVPTIITAVCDHPVAAICDASTQADLVVVGSRDLGGLGATALGSVSRGVLHHAHCPVAVVPKPQRQ
ncbi:universal stress protein [Nonomuraea sp. NPDC000554]|uniref:universal stress protein n=1 Tax=Nonomuraea sp. NPDC000554 TaxID=3154259 RepID=UPI00332BC8B9